MTRYYPIAVNSADSDILDQIQDSTRRKIILFLLEHALLSLINDGVPFIIDVLGFILNAPNCRPFSTVGLTVPLYGPPTLFPLES